MSTNKLAKLQNSGFRPGGRLLALGVIQALALTALPGGAVFSAGLGQGPDRSPRTQPDQMRVQAGRESASQAGLEGALAAPTLVSRVTEAGVQVARRLEGRVAASGSWRPGNDWLSEAGFTAGPQLPDSAATAAKRWLFPGIAFLKAYRENPIVEAVALGPNRSLRIGFVENHDVLFDWRPGEGEKSGALWLDVTADPHLDESQYSAGRAALAGLLLHHALIRAAGFTERQAWHAAIALHESMTDAEQEALQTLLNTPWIDHGNTLLTFLRMASDSGEAETDLKRPEVRGIDSMRLESRLEREQDPEIRALLLRAIHHRDRMVSWLMGQVRIDLPYDRAALRAAATDPNLPLDGRREAAWEVVRRYDGEVERENASRVSAHVRDAVPPGYPPPVVVAGRLSRAYSDQAGLFSDAALVPKTEAVVRAVEALDRTAGGSAFLTAMEGESGRLVRFNQEMWWLAQQTGQALSQLQPALTRLRLLAFGPDTTGPLTQYRGAIRQLREALAIFRDKQAAAIGRARQEAIAAAREGTGRRAGPDQIAVIEERFGSFETVFQAFAGAAGEVEQAIRILEGALAQAEVAGAAFSIQLQRPSRTGSLNLFDANELIPAPEQEPALQKLLRLGGHNTYASPDYEWVAHATDVVEAAPLSIYERVIEVNGKHVTVVEVDQEALEETIRTMADYWARNIETTMDSEHAALAREAVVEASRDLRGRAGELRRARGLSPEEAYLQTVQEADESVRLRVARTAAWLARRFDQNIEAVERYTEEQWAQKRFITRTDALRVVVIGDGRKPVDRDYQRAVTRARSSASALDAEIKQLVPLVTQRRRELPAFHMLTTEAPGLVEGFIQVVLEEEMALRNVIRGEGQRLGRDLEKQVDERMAAYDARFDAIAEQVVREFGYDVMVDSLTQAGLSRSRALRQVIGGNLTLREELTRIAVLAEAAEVDSRTADAVYTFDPVHPDHPRVEAVLEAQGDRLADQARQMVARLNRLDADFQAAVSSLKGQGRSETDAVAESIAGDAALTQEFESTRRQLARAEAFRQIAAEHPDWHLEQRMNGWYRNHTALARTTARREVIAREGLQRAMMDPRYYYGSGAVFQAADGTFQATGRRKRYHLIYAPSRVNLGKGELDSVAKLFQILGVTDPLAGRHAYRVYSLINDNPQIRTIKEAENFKVSENEHTALRRAVVNTQAFFSESLGYGDSEDLSFQFNMRGGYVGTTAAEGAGFQAGPTTGYCIPKDPLFKLLRNSLRDRDKLAQAGIPDHLHDGIMQMMIELETARASFGSEGAFEDWIAAEMLAPETLRSYFGPGIADEAQAALSRFIEVTGGVPVFHLSKIHEILGNLGRTSLLATHGHDLGLLLWAAWAGDKVTLGGEQVNRATAIRIVSDIFKLRDQAERLNPGVRIPEAGQMRVHGYWPYKTDPDHPSPPDVRDSVFGRVFMILSGRGELVAHALDEKGQRIYWSEKRGLRLDSEDPRDHQAARLLAEEFLGLTEGDIRRTDWFLDEWDVLREEESDANRFAQREAALLNAAFAEAMRRLKATGERAVEIGVLERDFQGWGTVALISGTGVPGVSTDDILGFKPDAKTELKEQADEVQAILQSYGLSPEQMRANVVLGRPLEEWAPLVDLPEDQREALLDELADGRHHPLAFRLRGPGIDFKQDLQGQDVLVFVGPHPDLLALNPAEIRDLMLTGRPNSVLGIRDGSVQGRHRVWFDRDIMLWYAAGRGVDGRGEPIGVDRWEERDDFGRRSVYTAFGFGALADKPLLGTNLREESRRQERRAIVLYQALSDLAAADRGRLPQAVSEAQEIYRQQLPPDQLATEALLAAEYQQMLQTKGVVRSRDNIIRGHLEEVARGLPPAEFTEAHWLSIGGMFLLNGAPKAQQEQVLETLRVARRKLQRFSRQAAGLESSGSDPLRELIVPKLEPAQMRQAERKGKMFSVKASEQQAARALARRRALQAEAARQATLALRGQGFRAAMADSQADELGAARADLARLTEAVGSGRDLETGRETVYQTMGAITARALKVMRQVNAELLDGDDSARMEIESRLNWLITGQGLSDGAVGALIGTYETPGIIPRWFEAAGEQKRERVAGAAELFHAVAAIEATAGFAGQPASAVDEGAFWRALAEFFSLTLDDHFHEYNPWVFDPKRGSGFSDFYNPPGALKPERAEELYTLCWNHHRLLYGYLRTLALRKTGLGLIPEAEQKLLLGEVELGETPAGDRLTVQGIGAGAASDVERKWRAYGQLREMAFLRNDGFALPVVFDAIDPMAADGLDAGRRVNFAFLAPVGRPHYARALMEAGALGENLFMTRDGRVTHLPGANGPVLQIEDAHFWLTEKQYRTALIRAKSMPPVRADQQIEEDRQAGRITPKGIRVAARFSRPVTVGAVVPMHHHPLIPDLTAAGYPYTDKSDVHYEITYDKSLYPAAFNPPHRTGVLLPPEIDWLRAETESASGPAQAKSRILERLRPFAREHGTIVVKGAAESGARNFKRFDLVGADGRMDEAVLAAAADFVHEVSKGQNVTIQRAIITTPLAWMSARATADFVDRQIVDWGVPVELNRHPKDWVYGTVRGIVSAGMPASLEPTEAGLFDPGNWRLAHRIYLNSLQVATNVGRQGTLEKLTQEMIRPEFRDGFLSEMEGAVQRAMAALARYGQWYWEHVYLPQRSAGLEGGDDSPRELDASGVPYWWPRYAMLDLLPEPVWGRNGREVTGVRVVDILPGSVGEGTENRFILEAPDGETFEGEILGFKFWMLEPNVGIGLWPNYWRRELVHEQRRAQAAGEPADWSRVGTGDRAVLNDYLEAGEAFLEATFGADYFGTGGPVRRPAAGQAEAAPESAAPFDAALAALRGMGITAIGPNQTSILLAEAAFRALGGREGLMSLAPEEVIARAKAWLAASERITEFPAGPGISVDPARQVGSWLHEGRTHRASFGIGEDYRTRVAELALDRVLSEPLTPPVEVAPHALPDAEVNRLLPHAKTFAVVTGKRALLNHHLYPWGMSAAGSDVNVVAVHEDWLTEDGRASRLMLLDPATGRPVEFVPNRPVVITHAFITELPADRETAAHRALDDRLSGSGVHLLNPAIHSNVRADDKTWLRTHATDGVTVPFSRTVPANSASDAALSRVQAVAGWAYDGLVVQPAADTTEAEGVRWFPGEEGQAAADYAAELSGSGPVLISTYHGNVTYQGRPVVFRFNVAAGRVASASAVVAAPGSRIANAGAGGEILPLDQVLAGLTGPNGQPIGMTAAAWRRLANQAEEAALAVGLGVAGVDLVMDTDPEEAPGEVQGVTLEINARPGLLIFGEQATFSEMGIHFRPAGSATAGFWNQLPPVSPELLERSHRPVIRQVMIVSRDLGGVERLRKMIRRDHPWVDILVFDDIESASGQFRKMRVGVVAPVGAVFWLSYSFAEDENAQADFFEEEGQMFPIHILGASAFRPEALEKTLQMVNRYLNQVGVRETLTLAQWREAVRFPDRSGLRAAVARQVPADEVDEELERIRDLVEQAAVRTVEVDGAEELLFDPDQPLALSFAPGRVRFFMGHTDIRGLGGQTINAATHYGAWALTQMDHYDPESRVVADNLDPQHPAFQFRLGDPDVLPPAGVSSIRPDWLAWAEAHGDPYKWQGNTRGLFAFMRTAYLDPEGHRRAFFENKGFRILVSESTLPPGQGLASSSALPGLLARGVQPFLPPEARLNAQQLNDMDYVAYVSGDRAGTADMTAINMGQLGQVSVLYSFPEAQGETVTLPDDFRLFVVNSTATPRLDDVNQTPENRDLARFIKSMTGMGPALAAVWLRHISRTRPAYGPLERLLMTDPAGAPFGLLRELTSIGNLADPQYVEMVGAETPEARAAFVERVLSEIPNDLTVEQILEQVEAGDLRQLVRDLLAGFSPMGASRLNAEQAEELEALKLQSVIPLRQMAAYGVREIERGVAYVAAAKAGRARELIRLMRRAHDGDRAVWEMNSGGQLEMTPWGKTEPEEAFFRSITVADAVVDAFQSAMDKQFGENAGAARTMAAGLGLGLAVGVTAEAYPAAKAFWKERGFDIIEVQPGGGATSVQLNLSAPVSNQAGLEAAVPVSFAGFRKAAGGYVVVPASVQTEQPVLIVTPEPAAIAKLTAAVTLTTASGLEAPRIEVLARDGVHAARLRDGLEAVGLRGFRVHDAAAAYGGNVGAAAEAIQFEHWRAGRATELVTAASGLESVVRFLGAVLPEAAAHALQAVIDRNQELFA